jgi:hypothetical protein
MLMGDAVQPDLDECLAHVVLRDSESWLGLVSPTGLSVFLAGAETRAQLTRAPIAEWRIHGPLEDPDFYLPLVARTGHPSLTIKWATAMELLHFSMTAAMTELRDLVEHRFQSPGFRTPNPIELSSSYDWDAFWSQLKGRPAMFLGGVSGWHLYWFLAGMARGGDWLGLPTVPRLREGVRAIAAASARSYGSEFAAYRICQAGELLALAGVDE